MGGMDPVELRQLRYFVAVAEELHFGRAAERVHMSQSPLSRAIRELERDLGLVLFVRTTRRVELTAAGSALLEHARRALAVVDAGIDDARRAAEPDRGDVSVGYTPFSRGPATRIATEFERQHPDIHVRFVEDVTPDLLRRVASHELTAAVVMETPAAARHRGIRTDTLKDERLLAAIPASHAYAHADAIPIRVFVTEYVLLPREPPGRAFNVWLRAVFLAAGFELDRTLETLSAPWDRRMLPVAAGENVSLVVGEWVEEPIAGVAAVPFDPPLSFPLDFASSVTATELGAALLTTAQRVRDAEGWLTRRPAGTELPTTETQSV
jgi:DNA-binding transcriptional LysR family regulator